MSAGTGKEASSLSSQWDGSCRPFSLVEIQSATQYFEESLVIGRGGFGKVYKGTIAGNVAAVKRLDAKSNQGAAEFRAEIETLSKLRHCHLVSLIGYCDEGEEMILVYEYMPNGTLEDHLHKLDTYLCWTRRLKICIGAARGLDYLHTGMGTQNGVIHRDVKSSNILLDENWAAKISDFGLSKIGPINQPHTYVSTGIKGTFGYLDPEYFSSCRLTRKSDVYAFGVVMLEALTGRRAVDATLDVKQRGLAGWARDCIKERKLDKLIDPSLRGQISTDCLKKFAQIANRCLQMRSKLRPTMAEVVFKLQLAFSLQERMNEDANSGMNNMTFIGKMWSLFQPKLKLDGKQVPAEGTECESSDQKGTKDASSDQVNRKQVHDQEYWTEGESTSSGQQFDGGLVFCDGDSFLTFEELLNTSFQELGELHGIKDVWGTYKISLASGCQVVVKRKWDNHFELEEHYLAALGRLNHPNVLALRAYYFSVDETLCIYDYMPLGSVASLLHSNKFALQYPTDEITIIMGITRGLLYLHTEENIVHGNLTLSNVLLDMHLMPMIADTGLAPSMNNSHNTTTRSHKHAPELLEGEWPNTSTDIYSLGVIMLELLTGKAIGNETDVLDLLHWVQEWMRERSIELFDPKPMKETSITGDEVLQTVDLALLCIQSSTAARPKAQEVLQKMLEIRPELLKIYYHNRVFSASNSSKEGINSRLS